MPYEDKTAEDSIVTRIEQHLTAGNIDAAVNLLRDLPDITPEDALQFTRKFSAMPFMGGNLPYFGRVTSMDDVYRTLDVMTEKLSRVAEEYNAMESELWQLRAERDAVRSFFGTTPSE